MINRDLFDLRSGFCLIRTVCVRELGNRRDGPRVTHVTNVDIIVNHKDYDSARACFVVLLVWTLVSEGQEVIFSFDTSFLDGCSYILGEIWLEDDVVVEVFF